MRPTYPTVLAAPSRVGDLCLAAGVPLELLAADPPVEGEPAQLRRFKMVAYTGAAMRVGGYYQPVVVDLAGMEISNQRAPVLRGHDPERIVGHTEAIEVTEGGRRLNAAGVISGVGEDAGQVLTLAANGFPWQASIGARPTRVEHVEAGQKVSVNGRSFTGPLTVVRQAKLSEISFVPMGADSATTAVVASEGGHSMTFEAWLQAKGFDLATLTDTQKAALMAAFQAENQVNANAGNNNSNAGATTPATTLDGVIAERRREQERQQQIATIVARESDTHPTQLAELEALGRAAIAGRWDVQRFELEVLRAMRPRTDTVPFARSGSQMDGRMLEAAVCMAGGLEHLERHYDERTLEAAQRRYRRGLGLGELILTFAHRHGYTDLSLSNLQAALRAAFRETPGDIRANVSNYSLSGILGNVANKFLAAGFESVESSWRLISAKKNVKDFKQITSYSLTGALTYDKVAPGGELKHGTLGELSYTNQADTYGKLLGIDRRDLINDDLGALTSASRRLGRGGALKLNDVFWTAFLDNSSFFASGNANYISGSTTVLSSEGLRQAVEKFRKQTDPDGAPLGLMPKFLVVPPELEAIADELYTSTNNNTGGSSTTEKVPNRNIWAGKYQPVCSPYLSNSSYTGYSTTAWYLLADPQDMPVIEVCFLNGVESPTVENADADFNVLGISLRGFHDFGVAKQEKRGGVKSKGAA